MFSTHLKLSKGALPGLIGYSSDEARTRRGRGAKVGGCEKVGIFGQQKNLKYKLYKLSDFIIMNNGQFWAYMAKI